MNLSDLLSKWKTEVWVPRVGESVAAFGKRVQQAMIHELEKAISGAQEER